MAQDKADYTLFFRCLCEFDLQPENPLLRGLLTQQEKWQQWETEYRERLSTQKTTASEHTTTMKKTTPSFILRNYLLQQAIELAQKKYYSMIDALMCRAKSPYDEWENDPYILPPPAWGKHMPINCSS